MVYQRATVKLQTPSDKDISKAMQIAAKTNGRIITVQIQGQERDQLVVIGEFDSTKLIKSLRNKFLHAKLMSLQTITTPENYNNNIYQYDHYSYPNNSSHNLYYQPQWPSSSNYYYDADYPCGYRVVRDSEPSTCSVM